MALPVRRELYFDAVEKDGQELELFLFQADFYKDGTSQTKEYVYINAEQEDGTMSDPLASFKEQWTVFCLADIPTEVFATDAMVIAGIFEAMLKQYPETPVQPNNLSGKEFLHDCISMGRVISMSVFDEEEYLSAGIRRRMKERYHVLVDELKAERNRHIFLKNSAKAVELFITDGKYNFRKKVVLQKVLKEETLTARLREILDQYPEADIILDKASYELYHVFHNMTTYMGVDKVRLVCSMESMFCALGKDISWEDPVETYVSYIKNQEDMRYGRFFGERLYSVHSFYLPVQISGEKAWKKQFKKNELWKSEGRERYHITTEGDLKGKYTVKLGREQFTLKLKKISLQRYLKKYAVLRLEMENYCYPGEWDKNRINELASVLTTENNAGSMELKIKTGAKENGISTFLLGEKAGSLWVNGLLSLGRKNAVKKNKRGLTLTSLKELMYCTEMRGISEEEAVIQTVLIKDGVFRRIEDALAKAVRPEKSDRPAGILSRRQKKEIRELYELYRYLVVSFGEGYEASQKKEQEFLYAETENAVGMSAVTERLQKKFVLFF